MTITQLIALVIFVMSYILIFSGRMKRTAAALIGLFFMVSAGYIFHFLTFESALRYVNWEVILLLFGMMIYVGLMAKTGFFKYLAVKAIKLSKGKNWRLFVYLCLITAFVSMIIDNVTTILLIIPITIEAAAILEISPLPILLGEAILSNIGGVATMIGDPPNIMIGLASGYMFNDFIIHLFLPVMASLFISVILARGVYRRWVSIKASNVDRLMALETSDLIEDRKRMKRLLYLFAGMLLFFSTEAYTGISPAFVAMSGGIIALLITMEDPEEAFKSVEWPTLMFFVALFVLVGGLEETGLLRELAEGIASLSLNAALLSIVILWVSGLSSGIVDNIPVTATFIPIISSLVGIYHSPALWWALAMGVGMGGNITPIGSSANVVTVSLSQRYGHEISLREWLKFGIPTGLGCLTVCTCFLLLMYA